jgi:hypothetical protein
MVGEWIEFPAVAHGGAKGVAAPGVNFSTPRTRCFGPRGEAKLECGQVAPCGGGVGGRTSSPDGGLGETPKDRFPKTRPLPIDPKVSLINLLIYVHAVIHREKKGLRNHHF